jgi:hypothetical protein
MRSIKSECLRKMIFFGKGMLGNAVVRYIEYYHTHRNHQGIGNLRKCPPPNEPDKGPVICEHELGGLLQRYHRSAASRIATIYRHGRRDNCLDVRPELKNSTRLTKNCTGSLEDYIRDCIILTRIRPVFCLPSFRRRFFVVPRSPEFF